MKRVTLLFICLLVAGCTGPTGATTTETQTYTIGATLPLSGDLAMYGTHVKNGAVLATEEINEANGINGRNLTLDVHDNQGRPKQAVNDANYLTQVTEVPVILNNFEHLTLATQDIARRTNTTMLTYTIYELQEKDNPQYLFRDFWDIGNVGERFARAANERNSSKAALLLLDDTSHQFFIEEFKPSYNGEIVSMQRYSYGTKDFRTQLTKIRNSDANTIVAYGLPANIDQILNQMSELSMTNYTLLTGEGTEQTVMQGNKALLQKTDAISYLSAELSQQHAGFIDRYKERFGETPRPGAFYAYQDVKMIASAMRNCTTVTGTCIRNQIEGEFGPQNNKKRKVPLVEYNSGWNTIKSQAHELKI